jgi:hypothetical protein
MELMTSSMVNLIKLVATVPPTTMSNPGRLMKTEKEPPIRIEMTTRIVPPARPIIVAISIGSVPEYQMC